MHSDQGQFDFEAEDDESGYRNWQAEIEERKKAFETKWGVRLGAPVRLQLRDELKPREGSIRLDPSHQPHPQQSQRLLIGDSPFFPQDIESLTVLEAKKAPDDEYAYLEEALPGFSRARTLIKSNDDKIHPLGFSGTKFDFYRFANRFRLAVSFEGMNLAGFSDETTLGYDALTRSFFVWSAFERYADLANDRAPFRALFAHHPRKHIHGLASHCRRLDPQDQLLTFLCDQAILPAHETYLFRYRDGHDFSVLTLAACMRHVFAHGNLTAHPNGLPADKLSALSRSLGNFLIHFIRTDFSRRLELAEATL